MKPLVISPLCMLEFLVDVRQSQSAGRTNLCFCKCTGLLSRWRVNSCNLQKRLCVEQGCRPAGAAHVYSCYWRTSQFAWRQTSTTYRVGKAQSLILQAVKIKAEQGHQEYSAQWTAARRDINQRPVQKHFDITGTVRRCFQRSVPRTLAPPRARLQSKTAHTSGLRSCRPYCTAAPVVAPP